MCPFMFSLLHTIRPQLGHWYFHTPSTWTLISVQSVSAVDPADDVEGEAGAWVVEESVVVVIGAVLGQGNLEL